MTIPDTTWWDEPTRTAASALSQRQAALLQRAAASAEWAELRRFDALREPSPLFPPVVQSWPIFLRPSLVDDVGSACSALVSALVRALSAPRPDEEADLERSLGPANRAAVSLLRDASAGTRPEDVCYRADLLEVAPGAFRCVELNVSAALGGWELSILDERAQRIELLRELVAPPASRVLDPTLPFFRELASIPIAEAGIAMVGGGRDFDQTPVEFAEAMLSDMVLRASGRPVDVRLLRLSQLAVDPEGLRWNGTDRSPTLLIDGSTWRARQRSGWSDEDERAAFAAARSPHALYYDGPLGMLLGDKRALAWVWRNATALPEPERDAVARILAPTWLVVPGEIRLDAPTDPLAGETAELLEVLARDRSSLVLKPGSGFGGEGVLVGRSIQEAEWQAAVREALARGDWVVQRALPEVQRPLLSAEATVEPHRIAWGWFGFRRRTMGVYPRSLPARSGDVVNMARGAESMIAYAAD